MKSIMRLGFIAGLLVLTGSVIGEDRIPWVADFSAACGMAAEQRRLVLLHFYNDNCGPCVRLEQNVFSKTEVADAVSQNYLAVKVHAGKNPQLATRYHINQWPTDVFVTPSGLEVFRTVSPQKPADYIAVLNNVALQAGVGAARQGKNPLQTIARSANNATQAATNSVQSTANAGQAAATNVAASATAGLSGAMSNFGQQAQQVSNETQRAAAEAQQKWNATKQQAQNTFDQTRATAENSVRQATATAEQAQQQVATTATQWSTQAQTAAQNAAQQTTAAAQQTTDTAKQWGTDINSAVQRYEQQASTAYQQARDRASQTSEQVQQQVQATKQEWQTTANQATQELNNTAQNVKQQASAFTSSLLDRRSAFVPVEASPAAAATAPAAPAKPATTPAATAPTADLTSTAPAAAVTSPTTSPAPPVAAATPPATTAPAFAAPPVTSKAPALVESPPITTSPSPTVTNNPWMAEKPATTPASAPAAATVQQQPQPQAAPAAPPESSFPNHQMVPVSQAPAMALDGFCPVTLMEKMAANPADRGAWKKGDKRFGAIHNGRTYLFASAEQQQKFLANPDAFAPALSGCDPVLYAERGQLVDGKRAYGIVTPDKHMYLFADESSRARFEQSPAGYAAAVQQAMGRTSGNLYR